MTPLFRNVKKQLEIPVEPALPCHTSTHFHRQDCEAERCSVKTRRERPLALSEGRLTLSDGRAKKTFESQRCILHQGEIIPMKITLQIEDFIHDINKIWCTLLCRSAKPKISCGKNCSGQRMRQVTQTAIVEYVKR